MQLEWLVSAEDAGLLLRDFLLTKQMISRSALAKIKHQDGVILVNEQEKNVRTVLKEKDKIVIYLPSEQPSASLVAGDGSLDIRYEDEHVLVINKRAGQLTIPSREQSTGTLANDVIGYYQQNGIAATFHAVNRLDKDTTGLLIVAKHRLAHDKLSKQQQKKQVKRYYEAIVEGRVCPLKACIDHPITRKPTSIIERMVHSSGQFAKTYYEVISQNELLTYVRIELETGRTHQIRVHFSSLGFPLCGDDLYGGHVDLISRQALHCYRVTFNHPFTGKLISLDSEMPEDMKLLLRKIKTKP